MSSDIVCYLSVAVFYAFHSYVLFGEAWRYRRRSNREVRFLVAALGLFSAAAYVSLALAHS